MDINKRDSRCNSRGITNNFSEQFSDSSSNNGMQHTAKSVNSPSEEENTQSITTESNSTAREGDIDTGLSSPNSKKSLSKQVSLSKIKPNISASKSIEQDIKKEDASLSPQNVSPLGFVPSSAQTNCDNDDNNVATILNKTTNLSPLSSEKSTSAFRSGCNELEERPTSASLAGNVSTNLDSGMLSTSISPKTSADGFGTNVSSITNISRNLNPFNGNLAKYNCPTQGESSQALNSGGGGGGGEYMQQQNHVFVFSTQLANKSADAVVGGQFPTIIAYHCMQPSTKLFLEDFLKNPAKTSKLHRQYSLNIMNVMQSGSSGQSPGTQSYWLNDCNNTTGKFSHRAALRNVGVNKTNPGWGDRDQPPPVLDNQVCATSNSLDILNSSEPFDNTKSAVCGIKVEDKSNIPSLQGVKVPDENLTPQQRQHREEQLAKLKKMNEFLFPENDGNDFQPGHGNNSAPPEAAANSLGTSQVEMMHNSVGNCSDGTNKMYQPSMRNISGNLGKQSGPGQGGTNLDSITGGLGGESVMPTDIMMTAGVESSNMGAMQTNKHGCIPSKMNTSNLNMIKSRGQCDVNEQSNAGLETGPDMTSSFGMKNCSSSSETDVVGGPSNMNTPQEEWAKYQNNNFHQEGFKNRNSNAIHNPAGMVGGSPQNPPVSRSQSIGVGGYGMQQNRPNTGQNLTNRNNSGPPPPYHQTQRSASVPIATQSPTHPNSNNSNTDMSLPSPQGGSRAPFGVSSTPPNADVTNSSTAITNPTHSSPASTSLANLTSGNVMSSSILSSMSTNPPPLSHSLSHISPRELDCIEGAQKLKRSSPQKFKGLPNNDMPDNTCMEPKYPNFGLNFSTCGMPVNAQNMRQNMQQMPSQFCRRIDNIPLNPNCNRIGQNKNTTFDPISSLAQMSQQLTGCGGMGLSTMGAGNNSAAGLMDINNAELMGGPPGRVNDHPLDHCNQMSNNTNNIGMIGLPGALGRPPGGQYAPDNMLCGDAGPMDQRMLNGKMCVPNFNPNALSGVSGLRDSNLGCNDMMASSRTMNHRRMPTNFDNFNMSPNVHVKVSAPNTIQYMPARSQNLNNMRVPPSIEFFQRYSNHQVIGNPGGHPAGQHHGPSDIGNNPNMMNLFGNCNQIPTGVGQLGGGGGNGGFEQNDLEIEGNILPNDDYMNVR